MGNSESKPEPRVGKDRRNPADLHSCSTSLGGGSKHLVKPTTALTKQAADPYSDKYLETPWRKVIMEKEELLSGLKTYDMYDSDIPCYNFLLLGMVGHGKSSIVNTTATAIFNEDKVIYLATAGGVTLKNSGSVTRKFRGNAFRKKKGEPELAKMRYFDTMGVEDTGGIEITDLNEILDGCVKNGYKFVEGGIDKKSSNYNKKPGIADKMHAVAACIDCTSLDLLKDDSLNKIRAFKDKICAKDIPFCILLTKIDCLMEAEGEYDITKVFYNIAVRDAVAKCAAILGVPGNQIFPIKNYESETNPDVNIDTLMLNANMHLMDIANGFIRNLLDDDSNGSLS